MGITRNQFLRLAAAGAIGTALPRSAAVAAQPSTPRRTLIRGADVLTMEKGAQDMPGTDVLIEGKKIAAIGRKLDVADAEAIDATGMILMPGMIDGHRHAWQAIDRGHVLNTTRIDYDVWKVQTMAAMTPEDCYLAEYLGCLDALDSGVTSVVDFSHGLSTPERALAGAKGAVDSGIAGFFCWQISHVLSFGLNSTVTAAKAWDERNAPPTPMHYEVSRRIKELYFTGSSMPLEFGMALSNNSLGRKMVEVIDEFRCARALEPRLITHHVRSTRADPPLPPGDYRSIADLVAADLIKPDYHVSHCNDWTDDELKMLGDHGGKLCSCPLSAETTSRYGYTCVFGRAERLGVDVGLGLDAPIKNVSDYFELVRAGYMSQFRKPDTRAIANGYSASDMLSFVTRGGARAIGLGDETGTISVGKRADLLLLSTARFGFPNWGGLADRVFNFAAQSDIDSTWVHGRRVKAGGKLVGVDWARLKADQAARQQRINRNAATVKVIP